MFPRFKTPVNLALVPGYLNFVTRPMDLSTVKDKLKNRLYASPLDFRDDVNLIWDNCACYNQEGTPARTDGEAMRGIWKRAWQESRIEDNWKRIQIEIDPSVRLPTAVYAQSPNLHCRCRNPSITC